MRSREQMQEAIELIDKYGSLKAASEASGIPISTLCDRRREGAKIGLMGFQPVLPGFHIKKTSTQRGPDGETQKEWIQQQPEPTKEFKVPEGHVIKGVSAYVRDGMVVGEWIKTKEGQLDPAQVAEWLKTAFADFQPAAVPAPGPAAPSSDLMTLVPCNDWHLGMFAWGREVGTNWDLKIAEDAIGSGVEDVILRSPQSARGIILVGGDLFHADNKENQTSRSKNQLDVDGRYQKVVEAATRLMVHTVDCALRRYQDVTVRVLPGNHDEHSSVAVTYFLKAWYRNEPRVTVDDDPSLFFYARFGDVLIGSTHGHTVKIAQMPQIMATRRAKDWGETTFRYIHGFHLHHTAKFATEGGGCISEVHQAPIPQDAWHYGSGFLSGPSLQAITYHRRLGETGRVIERMMSAMAEPVRLAA